ncbi:MAG: S41 family peptidase [Ruminococcus sp.]|nr:S41 family peptidase [Ruminococcus sp.]
MDSDSKHVLTILGLVACFGAGYFACKGENHDALALGEKFNVFTRIENQIDGKADMKFENEDIAIKNAVNGYYNTADRYSAYITDSAEDEEIGSSELPEFTNKYQLFENIVYINSGNFHVDGIQGFAHYFRDYPEPECDGFIIDLRQNTGGMTEYSISLLSDFLSPVDNLVILNYYDGTTTTRNISGNSKKTSADVVILVNEKTASAAEIFTSAMKQFYDGNVTIIGTQTRGKGSFQEVVYLSDNEQFKYTAGKYTVGNWQCYDGVGISPDIEISMDYQSEIICTDDDIQFQSALELFK